MSRPVWAFRKPSAFANQFMIRHRRHVKRRISVATCPFCGVGIES